MSILKALLKKGWRTAFELGQRAGVNILPSHYYSEVPVISELRKDASWKAPRTMTGVEGADVESQLRFLEDCCSAEMSEYLKTALVHEKAARENGEAGYGPVEADFLFAYIVRFRPGRIVQVGCGVSTSVILQAAAKAQYTPSITCVEPYPNEFLKRASREGRIRLVAEKAERVSLELLTDIGENDLLFVDSTHTVKPGGEVNRIILEVLPRLSSGVHVHFHDIYFPYDYQRTILDGQLFFQNESTLLHAFLIGNRRVSLMLALSMLHYARPDALRRRLPSYDPQLDDEGLVRAGGGSHFPSSAYLRVENP